MATLNVTLNGVSADLPLELAFDTPVADVKRIAWEVLRAGGANELRLGAATEAVFEHYVVDRFQSGEGGDKLYLRPKVPFGARP